MRLRWTGPAKGDLHRHWMFHASRNVDYADRVYARLQDRANGLLANPDMGRRLAGQRVRELSVTDIQYVIIYQPGDEEILILRVWSTAEDC